MKWIKHKHQIVACNLTACLCVVSQAGLSLGARSIHNRPKESYQQSVIMGCSYLGAHQHADQVRQTRAADRRLTGCSLSCNAPLSLQFSLPQLQFTVKWDLALEQPAVVPAVPGEPTVQMVSLFSAMVGQFVQNQRPD